MHYVEQCPFHFTNLHNSYKGKTDIRDLRMRSSTGQKYYGAMSYLDSRKSNNCLKYY